MPLDDIREKIYDPEEDLGKRVHEASPFDTNVSLKAGTGDFQKEKAWEAPQKGFTPEQKKVIKIAAWIALGIVLVVALASAVVLIRRTAFSESRVSIEVIGAESAESNDLMEYRLAYKNENRAALKDAEIVLKYSESFKPEEGGDLKVENLSIGRIAIGDIEAHSQGEKIVTGNFFAPANTVVFLDAGLEFTPSGFSSRFRSEGKIGVNIRTSPLSLEVEAPFEIISGKKIDYVVNYKNMSSSRYSNVRVSVEYPKEFNFTSANPPAFRNNEIWNIGDLEPGSAGKIVITGNISGVMDESKILKASIGAENGSGEAVVFEEKERATKILASPLFVYQQVDSKAIAGVNAGQSIYYTLFFGNTGSMGLRNSIITMEFKGEAVDYSSLRAAGGFFNESARTITWKASEIPELAKLEPGSKESFRFEVRTFNNLPIDSKDDKNFVIDTLVKIDSPDIPTPILENKLISSNRLELKINSPVALDVKGFYFDDKIENFGPVPPFLGQETSYAIHWKATNASNDLSDVQVVSFLSTGVKWTGKVFPEAEQENIKYDERTNQVAWKIGPMENGIGFTSAPREVVFQVSITPQINQVGSKVKLLDNSVLTGKDLFTGAEVKVQTKEKSTDLYEDTELGFRYAVVDK